MLTADILAWAGLVSSRDEAKVTVWCAVGAAVGVYLFYRGFRMLQFKRLVLNTPLSKVRGASMGLVELSGMAVGPSTIPAGITGDDCYYYRATAWELQQSGNSRQWKQVANESLFVPFFVQDDTGRMLVNAQGADMDVHCNFKSEYVESFFGGGDMPMGPAEDFLLRHGVSGHRVRVEEYCIKPDYPLFVLGTLGENTARASSLPQKHVCAASSAINVRSSSRPPAFGVLGMFGGSSGRQAEIYASAGGPAASSWTGSSNGPSHGPSHGPSTWPSAPLPGHSSAWGFTCFAAFERGGASCEHGGIDFLVVDFDGRGASSGRRDENCGGNIGCANGPSRGSGDRSDGGPVGPETGPKAPWAGANAGSGYRSVQSSGGRATKRSGKGSGKGPSKGSGTRGVACDRIERASSRRKSSAARLPAS